MTTEIEKTFLDTFGIVPNNNKCELAYCAKNLSYNCNNCEHFKPKYPKITDTHYLGLLCILPDYDEIFYTNKTILKESILQTLIMYYEWYSKSVKEELIEYTKEIKENIHKLFEESEQE